MSNAKLLFIVFSLILSVSMFSGCKHEHRKKYPSEIYREREDSICKLGKKYIYPLRTTIIFPAKKVTNKYKIREMHKAIPDSLNNENNTKKWYYDYYFVNKVLDYDSVKDQTFTPAGDNFLYKLKDTYFFDINGDGLLDFIHYPEYYRKIAHENDVYELFIQEKNGSYKWITFVGYIVDIEFNKDGTLNKMKTYSGACCDDNHATFYYYTFDKNKNDLIETEKEEILTCQLIREKK